MKLITRFALSKHYYKNMTSHTSPIVSHLRLDHVNSSPPSTVYMRQWSGPALVQIIASRLDGAKPLSEPILTYCQLNPKESISMKFYLKFKYFHSRKCVWTCRLRNGGHFVQGKMRKYNEAGAHFIRSKSKNHGADCFFAILFLSPEVNLYVVKKP